MQCFPAAGDAATVSDFALHKLILPGESVGNVGQLAVDLLIATCGGMRLVGYLESPFVQPVAGLDAFRSDGTLHLALELYEDAERGLFVLQQRAPTLRGCAAQFAAQLADWLHSSGFSEVIYLSSLDARVRQDAQMAGSQLRFIAADDVAKQLGSSLCVSELEAEIMEAAAGEKLLPPWPLLEAAQSRELPLLTLVTFSSEGDNVGDAQDLCTALGQHLNLSGGSGTEEIAWRQPQSWESVFGRPRDIAAY